LELRDVLQVKEEAQRVRARAGKPAACVARSGGGGAMWRGEEGLAKAGKPWAPGSWSSGKWPARVAGSRARAEQRKDWR
jgi:hypothetical protein